MTTSSVIKVAAPPPASAPHPQGQPLKLVPLSAVRFGEGFWARRLETNRAVTIPLEYEINRKNGVLGAYRWEWVEESDPPPPWRIIVGDLGKWIEAASYCLTTHPDAELEQRVEEAIARMMAGQKDDGYLHPNPLRRGQKWANLQEYHELYEIGHDIEAAVAHFAATGRRHFLDAMCRAADLIDASFGWVDGKRRGYDGHPEIELALVKLYRATGERRYLDLATYFVDVRGTEPHAFVLEAEELKRSGMPTFGWYKDAEAYRLCQAHRPLREQEDAVGHAVRALYLYSGAADVAAETGDAGLLETCRRMWKSITRRRMYVTGGVGSTPQGEAFTFDYDLPNETGYAETCASIALVFFAHRMLQIEADAEYADVMERALYNGVLSGIGLDGRTFFYANHLTVYPPASQGAHGHVAAVRQGWFGCACCPPNIARLLASLGQYVYSTRSDSLFVHLYADGEASCNLTGKRVTLRQTTRYPWDETVALTIGVDQPTRFVLALRVPGWCRRASVRLNGKPVRGARLENGYLHLRRVWQAGDRVELRLPMPVERLEAHPSVRMDAGKVALQRGPIVYCIEEVDNGDNLADLVLPRRAMLSAEYRQDLLGGCVVIRGKARRRDAAEWEGSLYRAARSKQEETDLLAVPYALWGNRQAGEMLAWVREA